MLDQFISRHAGDHECPDAASDPRQELASRHTLSVEIFYAQEYPSVLPRHSHIRVSSGASQVSDFAPLQRGVTTDVTALCNGEQ
jgi:hypothetical protein